VSAKLRSFSLAVKLGKNEREKKKNHINCNQFSRSDAREKTLQKQNETHSREAYYTRGSVPVALRISIVVKRSSFKERRPTTTVRASAFFFIPKFGKGARKDGTGPLSEKVALAFHPKTSFFDKRK